MKALFFVLGLIVAIICGYSVEPQLRMMLTGKGPGVKTLAPVVENAPKGDAEPGSDPAEPSIDLSSVPAERLPEKVQLKADAELVDPASGIRMRVPAGNRMNLVRLDGANVIISPGTGSFEGSVPVSQTDLVEQLTAAPAAEGQETAAAPEPLPEEQLDEVIEVQPESSLAPAPQPEVAPAPQPEVAPAPAPAPEPTPEPLAGPAPAGDAVAIMKASIQAGQISEFKFDQVLEWEAGPAETVDGVNYLTGLASYKAETVFGVKTIQAKALISDGKVVRWLWPKSGMEIK